MFGLNITEMVLYLVGLLLTAFGSLKYYVVRAGKAIDEVEDVVVKAAEVMEESAKVMTAFVSALKPDEDGNIKITPEEWNEITNRSEAVKETCKEIVPEVDQALAAIKDIFKKDGKSIVKSIVKR